MENTTNEDEPQDIHDMDNCNIWITHDKPCNCGAE